MSRRGFPRVPVRRADFGPAQPGYRITCGACRAVDEVVVKGRLDDVVGRFRARGWLVGEREADDRCPDCNPRRRAAKTEDLPMVKTKEPLAALPAPTVERSEDAILARKLCDDLLLEHLDMKARRFQPGWSDARIAKESGWSEAAVRSRRVADYFEIAVTDVPIARVAEIETALGADLGELHAAWRVIAEAGAALARGELALRKAEAAVKTRAEALRALVETGGVR